MNGLNAAALYVGSFAMTLVAERLLGWVGFKTDHFGTGPGDAVTGRLSADSERGRLVCTAGACGYWGQRSSLCGTAMGTNDVNGEEPGAKHILYGMSYGLGFSIGPLGIPR